MRRILRGVALATAMMATAADATPRHKHHHVTRVPQVAVQRAPRVEPAITGQCWTDEGYGRRTPCGGGGGGGGSGM